ncbi:glycosyl transferase family protein [Tianweitania sediminis]|uniref:Glycosyl transferase family protein n=1 Tax=Tianweitania sediminis TaxID=1502156 RepID=A0A8J7QWI6_9HYPH|nr:glycosyl transferase family protein [Tianweitania sediminis]MBP0437888.1 glycosyl transferase family protein [Tianweitania sediminis]
MNKRLQNATGAGSDDGAQTSILPGEPPFDGSATSSLGGLRLLVALDALLVEQSVGRAAARLGIRPPAMSRILKQIRDRYGDRILRKTARGMVPTPFAETLRLRLRALAAEAADLMDPSSPMQDAGRPLAFTNRSPIREAPPLTLRRTLDIGGPTPEDFARKLEQIGPGAEPRRRLARFIATIGVGAGQTRPLTLEEADEAFTIILDGEADPIQIGAFLVVLQYRGITAMELAGVVKAGRRHIGAPAELGELAADLDWPAYLSPRSRAEPWFFLAAKLVAQAGYRVVLHGSAGTWQNGSRLAEAAEMLHVPVARSIEHARTVLAAGAGAGLVYLPLPAFAPQIAALLALYGLFEMRSPLNLATALLNPIGACASVLGASRSAYQLAHRDAAALLGWSDLAIHGSHRDVWQATPDRATRLDRLVKGLARSDHIASRPQAKAPGATGLSSLEYWKAVWDGRAPDCRPRQIVIDTAALALLVLEHRPADGFALMQERATALWADRLV